MNPDSLIHVYCPNPNCHKGLKGYRKAVGRRCMCPHCKTPFVIVRETPVPAGEPAVIRDFARARVPVTMTNGRPPGLFQMIAYWLVIIIICGGRGRI